MADNKITGTAIVKVDGDELETLDDGVTVDIGGVERPAKKGSGKVSGYQEKVTEPTLEVKVHHKKNTSLAYFNNITDATIEVVFDTGVQFIYQQAWTADSAKADASAGEVSLKFHAIRCDEVL